tara:strand:- start:377 stop:913 length:537 start_codon:yes stop_codon:yes gene_type:complete
MIIESTKFPGLLIVKSKNYKDKRGLLREVLIEKIIKKSFKFHLMSISKKNVLRGLHFQLHKPQGKFVSVIKGKIFDVSVDLRKKSKTFCKFFSIELSDKNCKSIYIPPGFAHGFMTLEKENIICYSCTEYRSKKTEKGLFWKDKDLNIKWPTNNPIITKKDKKCYSLKELINKINFKN